MESSISEFVTTHFVSFLVFSMMVYITSAAVRKLVETCHPKICEEELRRAKIWRELCLPTLPVLLGIVFALLCANFPSHEDFKHEWAGRVLYGVFLGFFSGWVYRILKVIVQRKWEVDLSLTVEEPPPNTKRSSDNV